MTPLNKLPFVLQLSLRKVEMKMDRPDPVITDKLPLNIENIHAKYMKKICRKKKNEIKLNTELWIFYEIWRFFSKLNIEPLAKTWSTYCMHSVDSWHLHHFMLMWLASTCLKHRSIILSTANISKYCNKTAHLSNCTRFYISLLTLQSERIVFCNSLLYRQFLQIQVILRI